MPGLTLVTYSAKVILSPIDGWFYTTVIIGAEKLSFLKKLSFLRIGILLYSGTIV